MCLLSTRIGCQQFQQLGVPSWPIDGFSYCHGLRFQRLGFQSYSTLDFPFSFLYFLLLWNLLLGTTFPMQPLLTRSLLLTSYSQLPSGIISNDCLMAKLLLPLWVPAWEPIKTSLSLSLSLSLSVPKHFCTKNNRTAGL